MEKRGRIARRDYTTTYMSIVSIRVKIQYHRLTYFKSTNKIKTEYLQLKARFYIYTVLNSEYQN